jgi:hypothetical protein
MPIPLYGFVQGDTMGLVYLVHERETVQDLIRKVQLATKVRVRPMEETEIVYKNQKLEPQMSIAQVEFEAMDRFDLIPKDVS